MADEALKIAGEVSVLRLQPGDKVVVRHHRIFPVEAHCRIKEVVASTLGIAASDVLVLDGGLSIEALRKDAA